MQTFQKKKLKQAFLQIYDTSLKQARYAGILKMSMKMVQIKSIFYVLSLQYSIYYLSSLFLKKIFIFD